MSLPLETDAAAAASTEGLVRRRGPLLRVFRDQRVAFLVVGAVNTAVGYGWFVFFELAMGRWLHYLAVLLCAHVAAVLCAFVLYRRVVFRVRGNVWLDLARFETVYLVSLALNLVLLLLLVEVLDLKVLLSQALALCIIAVTSFIGHKHFSFRRPSQSAS